MLLIKQDFGPSVTLGKRSYNETKEIKQSQVLGMVGDKEIIEMILIFTEAENESPK